LYFDTKCFVTIDSLTLTHTFVKNSKTTLIEYDRFEIANFILNFPILDLILMIGQSFYQNKNVIDIKLNDLIENVPMVKSKTFPLFFFKSILFLLEGSIN
jgi:hypothetical protein